MKITETDVRYVADLANLRLNEDEVAAMAHDLDELLGYIGKLAEVDTTGVEPMAQVLAPGDPAASLRPDDVHAERQLNSAIATANAPVAGAGCFKVPKVIER